MRPDRLVSCLLAVLVIGSAGCVTTGGQRAARSSVAPRTKAVVVGAFNFSESRVLAEIFAQTLRAAGIEAELLGEVGSREIMGPALEQGQIDLVAEYLGTALTFLDPESDTASGVQPAYARLQALFGERGIEVLTPSPGENRNEIVVTESTAARYHLRTISDLGKVAEVLVMGGPPECPSRPLCLQGLEELYELEFKDFVPLDSGGPATVAALMGREIDVALLFTTNPAIDVNDLVVLRDDKGLQPAENIVPVIRREVMDERGEVLAEALAEVTSELTDRVLRTLNARAELDHVAPEVVAADWLEEQGVL